MSYNLGQQTKKTARVRYLFVAALVLACAFGTVTNAVAQNVTPPPTPTAITPPEGNSAFLVGHAQGTQGYVCLPDEHRRHFLDHQPRPPRSHPLYECLRAGRPDHYPLRQHRCKPQRERSLPVSLGGNATWQSSFDTSKVWAAVQGPQSSLAGTDARVARILARFPASCCSQSETNRGQRAVSSWQTPPSSNA